MNNYGKATEDYLEAILILQNKNSLVKAIDLANYFEYKRSTISVAVKNMKAAKLITVDESHYIILTQKGLNIAKKTYEKHMFFKNMLLEAGVHPDIAEDTACRMEHDISDTSFNLLKKMKYHF